MLVAAVSGGYVMKQEIVCQKCGAEVIKIGNRMRVVIPSINYECKACGSRGVFDMIFGETEIVEKEDATEV